MKIEIVHNPQRKERIDAWTDSQRGEGGEHVVRWCPVDRQRGYEFSWPIGLGPSEIGGYERNVFLFCRWMEWNRRKMAEEALNEFLTHIPYGDDVRHIWQNAEWPT